MELLVVLGIVLIVLGLFNAFRPLLAHKRPEQLRHRANMRVVILSLVLIIAGVAVLVVGSA